MVLATVPEALPTRKNQRATSCPAPISANVPYFLASRLICNAFSFVLGTSPFMRGSFSHSTGFDDLKFSTISPNGFDKDFQPGAGLIYSTECCRFKIYASKKSP